VTETPFRIREGKPIDLDFIEGSWVENLRGTSPHTRGIESSIYFPRQRALIRRILAHANVICAVDPQDEDVIWGYLVFEPGQPFVAHFAYTKRDFRSWVWAQRPAPGHYIRQEGRGGVAKALVERASGQENPVILATAYTDSLGAIIRSTRSRIVVDPYLLHER
jgi:hypothetical protein